MIKKMILQLDNLSCSRTLGAVNNLKCYPSAFLKGFETLSLDCGVMNKNISSTILLDKTKTLRIVKPFYGTFSHFYYSLLFAIYIKTA